MALVLTKEPPAISLSENDILLGIQKESYIPAAEPYSDCLIIANKAYRLRYVQAITRAIIKYNDSL